MFKIISEWLSIESEKMKLLLEDQPSNSDISNNGSSSGALCGGDQEMGSNTMSTDGDNVLMKNPLSRCLQGVDLNPVRMVLAEMIATFILMFSICGMIASTQLMRGDVGLLEYASTAGSTVIVIIFSIGPISGAHFNPAVTIAFATFGHFPWSRVPFYIVAQILGSAFATYIGWCVYGVNPELFATRAVQGPNAAFWVEFIATFIILFLAASILQQSESIGCLAGFVFGVAIALAVLISGPVSGGSLNPARSLGPAIVAWNFKDIWIYITAPVAGAIAGAAMFHLLKIRNPQSIPIPSSGCDLPVSSVDFGSS